MNGLDLKMKREKREETQGQGRVRVVRGDQCDRDF